jgi:DNA-3-methyladenine glycosylase I
VTTDRRCSWAESAPEYLAYHDDEWGRPVRGDDALFERVSLEAFQSGLSWITILRKRENFRRAFASFHIPAVAAFDGDDQARLMADAGIVRNSAKIAAVIANARAIDVAVPEGLTEFLWSFAPPDPGDATDPAVGPFAVRAVSPASVAMSKELKRRGFRFVGPTTAYSLMQAVGMVNDHQPGCRLADPRRDAA